MIVVLYVLVMPDILNTSEVILLYDNHQNRTDYRTSGDSLSFSRYGAHDLQSSSADSSGRACMLSFGDATVGPTHDPCSQGITLQICFQRPGLDRPPNGT
jgi:hypothetical protein